MKINIAIILTVLLFFKASLFYGDISKTDIIGYSVNNKKISLYKFGNGKNILIIIAAIHGNERNTNRTALELIDLLNQKKIRIPGDKSVWIIPGANPDGLARDRRLNDNDVDLNRNFDTKNWKSTFYFFNILLSAGKHPFSEPETIALKNFFESIDKRFYNPIVLSLHSRGDVIIPGNNSLANKKLVNIIKNNSSYKIGDIGYNTTGDLTRWLSNKHDIPSATIEFKTKKNSEINEIEKIVTGLLRINFAKEIYKYSFNTSTDKLDAENINKLLYGLSDKIKNNITSSESSINEFADLFQSIQEDNEDLLLLVNKSNYLPESYVPGDLVDIIDLFPSNKKQSSLRNIIIPDLKEMFEAANSQNIKLQIISAYRSYEDQKNIYQQWINTLGEEEAKRVSAPPGASQHQLGTTIDFNSLENSFAQSKEGQWLAQNSYKYGFVMSYPEGQEELTGYKYEPWHFRYIGKKPALLVYKYFDNLLEVFLNWFWQFKIEK